jgi:hypothetical protein
MLLLAAAAAALFLPFDMPAPVIALRAAFSFSPTTVLASDLESSTIRGRAGAMVCDWYALTAAVLSEDRISNRAKRVILY